MRFHFHGPQRFWPVNSGFLAIHPLANDQQGGAKFAAGVILRAPGIASKANLW